VSAVLAGVEARLDRLGHALLEWWAWPAALVALGVLVVAASWAFVPDAEGQVALLGFAALPPCPTLVDTGLPCSQCGMTRSWVWAARGAWPTAVALNPAGFVLWVWLVSGALVGAVRLVRRAPRLLRLSWPMLGLAAWLWVVLLLVTHELRLAGQLPLP
jgi:hypothetical protein